MNILCFGDSNTYGLVPATTDRYGWGVRWTSIINEKLGLQEYRVIEEGLCGRTTVFDDPFREGRRGTQLFPTLLETHRLLDCIVIMLGTNDCKTVYGASAGVIAKGVEKLIEQAQENKYKEIQRKQRQATQDAQPAPPTTYPETQPTEIPIPDETQLPPAPLETAAEYIPPTAEQPAGQPASTPVPTDNYLSYIPLEGNEQKLFYKKEQLLLQMIVRYGEKVMCYFEDENGEEQPLTVIECISSSLKEDELQFHYPLDRRILKEAENHLHDEGFVSERYFLTHPDPEISKQAAELASDRYQLSKYHSKGQAIITDEERLYELVPRLLIDFKLSIVEEEMKHTLQALANPDIYNNPEKCQEIMQHYKELQKIQIPMAQKAGDRVILR